MTPILFFAAAIFAVALMIEGYIQAASGYSYYAKKFKSGISKREENKKRPVKKSDFKRISV
ncbi:hypothetical protein V1502_11925 [Bacillus sp. SCS-153A]|uniref:hypothetical protein n=1 Tax=Rossellomorea sedimentorum TaxID=3115294 RepID=UPI0039066B4A